MIANQITPESLVEQNKQAEVAYLLNGFSELGVADL